jgi:hypothetical protein
MPQKKRKEDRKDEKGFSFSVRSCFRIGDGVFPVNFSFGTGKSDETQTFDYMAAATPLLANVW